MDLVLLGDVDLMAQVMRCTLDEQLGLAVREVLNGWSVAYARSGQVLAREGGAGLRPILKLARDLAARESAEFPAEAAPCALADKVLGLAAFRLGSLLGAKKMWGELASELAVVEGRRRGIEVRYHRVVPAIMNQKRDDLCPMERLAYLSRDDFEFFRAVSAMIR